MAPPPVCFIFNNSPPHFIVIKNKTNYYSTVKHNTAEAIVGLAVTSLLSVLQLKFQSSTVSPFKKHPVLMAIAIVSLLIYCFGCDLEHHINSCHRSLTWATPVHNVLRLFAFISIASFLTIIFSTCSKSSILDTSIYLVFGLFFTARLILQCIHNGSSPQDREGYSFTNSQRRVNFPFLNAFTDQIDTLPVYRRPSTLALIE